MRAPWVCEKVTERRRRVVAEKFARVLPITRIVLEEPDVENPVRVLLEVEGFQALDGPADGLAGAPPDHRGLFVAEDDERRLDDDREPLGHLGPQRPEVLAERVRFAGGGFGRRGSHLNTNGRRLISQRFGRRRCGRRRFLRPARRHHPHQRQQGQTRPPLHVRFLLTVRPPRGPVFFLGRIVRGRVPRNASGQKGDGSLLPERPFGCFAQKTPVPFLAPRPEAPPDSS